MMTASFGLPVFWSAARDGPCTSPHAARVTAAAQTVMTLRHMHFMIHSPNRRLRLRARRPRRARSRKRLDRHIFELSHAAGDGHFGGQSFDAGGAEEADDALGMLDDV